uniref:DUF4371 domain-containing protein n=1 Tax=Panagrolaimus superbus TaxID=310955 RepID=A0A914Y3P5_9BILA
MFSIIIEEATGISNSQKEQLCLTVRYYYDGEVCENFLIIRPLPSEKSDEITKHIMDAIKEVGIDFNKAKLIGQEYRGKNAASGNNGGIQKAIKDLHPMAFYIHPSAHSFNSAICNATTVQLVTVVMMQINKISQFTW